ncbi:hypothetical protein CLHOM_24090 [Clostridium homopropionicum DSM 5847]|uniref:Uncharacterized protein n=1 Tax=Clostridium homopropionicum DSM 5847 TaxID=1121318 RepID=A0A0L6Z950_9CLOT|nr:hypothetical protein [Clostridium homopropionicum]KOA19303.1 hypothetical protein CLHOM_24090 [Clostridium homopropionicum DSM 5847]SFG20427.1 ferrous iron transport protein B [Clostridium homopropionicum]
MPLSMLINQLGTIVVYGKLATGFIPSVLISVLLVIFLVYSLRKNTKTSVSNTSLT